LRDLHVRQETAWFMLHRIRKAMHRTETDCFVEVASSVFGRRLTFAELTGETVLPTT
jgi:hypothetical protein